jgi:alpha-1,6-mannosyltransferase
MLHMTPARCLFGAGAGIAALTGIALSLHMLGSIRVGTLPRRDAVVALMLASGGLFGGAAWFVMGSELPRGAWIGVLAVAVTLRMMLMCSPPFMSSDNYRHVWDGRVQQGGINPFAYVPAYPPPERLRDAGISAHQPA